MATTKQIAEQLRIVAKHLDDAPEEEIGGFMLTNPYGQSAEQFKACVKAMPRPLSKRTAKFGSNEELVLENHSNVLKIYLTIDRSKVCRVVTPAQPAVYECEPLFSPEEEAEL